MKYLLIVFLFFASIIGNAQDGEWLGLPLLNGDGATLMSQESFTAVISAATISFVLAQYVFKNNEHLNFYQARFGVYGTAGGTVIMENFGIEKRLAPWFGLGIEVNNQQWIYQDETGAGMGLNLYYRWHLFGRKKLSPFLEYGSGFFYGFSEFPPNGTNFTFNLSTQIGVEYTFDNANKLRVGYGHLHQSNNELLEPNPGEDGNGFNITYLWSWQ